MLKLFAKWKISIFKSVSSICIYSLVESLLKISSHKRHEGIVVNVFFRIKQNIVAHTYSNILASVAQSQKESGIPKIIFDNSSRIGGLAVMHMQFLDFCRYLNL